MRHFSNCFNVNHGAEEMGYPDEQSRDKVFSGRLSLVMAEWAAMTFPKLRQLAPGWKLNRDLILFP